MKRYTNLLLPLLLFCAIIVFSACSTNTSSYQSQYKADYPYTQPPTYNAPTFNISPIETISIPDFDDDIRNDDYDSYNNQYTSSGTDYIGNKNTKKFHYSWCSSVTQMKESNKYYYTGTRQGMISKGYEPCKRCDP